MSGFTLDTGALIAAERGDKRIIALLDRSARRGIEIAIPAGVLAQVWRADPRQHRLHLLLADDNVEVPPLDRDEALAVGTLCASSGVGDVTDASVVSCARLRQHAVLTSDPDDLQRIDRSLVLVPV
ncbi:MAG TPA: PIN domain-containing protein [Mycobacteriales bacterium]|nr:PIN domain-containing protein [Mycobacteriales bacterium]